MKHTSCSTVDSLITPPRLEFCEGKLKAREIFSSDHLVMEKIEKLRYRYFVEEKRWVEADPTNINRERDEYDDYSHHLGVFYENNLVAYMRLLGWSERMGYMLDKDFSLLKNSLHEDEDIIHAGGSEISRLVINTKSGFITSTRDRLLVLEMLFKLFYQLAQREGYLHFYIEVEEDWLKRFNLLFPFSFRRCGKVVTFPDGAKTVLAHASLSSLEDNTHHKRSLQKLQWYQAV